MDGGNLKAVLFDLDDTVYSYAPCHAAGLSESHLTAKKLHGSWMKRETFDADYDQARRQTKQETGGQAGTHCRLLYFKHMLENRLGGTKIAESRALHAAYWKGFFSAMKIDPGCAELIVDLRARGIRIAWVTNFTTDRQMLKLTHLGLAGAADFLVTSEEAGAEKPAPAPFELALSKLGVKPSQTAMVGDDLDSDYRAGKALGLQAIWLNRGNKAVPDDVTESAADWRELAGLFSNALTPKRRAAG